MLIVGSFVIMESKSPKYVIPTSNFTDRNGGSYLLGIPCLVVSEPYMSKRYIPSIGFKKEMVIDVVSTVTNIKYTIPVGWYKEYNSLEEANEHAHIKGTDTPDVKNLIGKKYWPCDNSWIRGFDGEWASLYKKECEIVSVPFVESILDLEFNNSKRVFILVKYEDRLYRVLFEEWALMN